MIRMVFAEMQSSKGVENYFTDFLLCKENGKIVKKSLPDDIDSGNEVDSESGTLQNHESFNKIASHQKHINSSQHICKIHNCIDLT